MKDLTSRLVEQAHDRPQAPAITFLRDGDGLEETIDYLTLHETANALAARMEDICAPGDRVLLPMRSSLAFLQAFIACQYAGLTAVPLYPPRARDSGALLRRIARDSGCHLIVSHPDIERFGRDLLGQDADLMNLPWLTVELELAPRVVRRPSALRRTAPADLALLQYTSGSTSEPKGVMVTQANLVANFEATYEIMGPFAGTTSCSWLPLNHDMGLIGLSLNSLYFGVREILMSPAYFLQRPLRWIEAIAKYRAVVTGAPNFAYDLCARRAMSEAIAGLDLSACRVAFVGAEPVREDTLDRFATAFAPAGFRRDALLPCYGLAEFTLIASGGRQGAGPRSVAVRNSAVGTPAAVSCGAPAAGHRIAIVDPERRVELPESEVGEIWLAGPSRAAGYWRRPDLTEAAFEARLDNGEGPFLKTGDLGCLTPDGLVVTGRFKDLLIVRGRNVYPQDLEATSEETSADWKAGAGAAVDTGDGIVLLQELKPPRGADLTAMARAIAQRVLERHEVAPARVLLVRIGDLPRTTSGKVRRTATQQALAAGEIRILASYPAEVAAPAAVLVGE